MEQVFVVLTFLMFAVQPSAVVVTAGVVLPVDCTKLIPPAPYAAVYFTESAKYASSAVTRFRRSDFIDAMYAFSLVAANFGIAMAARMPMITTTISSSISVKPFRFNMSPLPAKCVTAETCFPSPATLLKQSQCQGPGPPGPRGSWCQASGYGTAGRRELHPTGPNV